MRKYIVGMGEALWDCLPEGRKIGGAPANFAYHAAQFGFNSLAVSAIGKDELGDEIVDTFNQNNLKHHLERVDCPTGTVQVTLDEKGIPCYEIMENVAWDNNEQDIEDRKSYLVRAFENAEKEIEMRSFGYYSIEECDAATYTLPDPLRTFAGEKIASAAQWSCLQRREILELLKKYENGEHLKGEKFNLAFCHELIDFFTCKIRPALL